MRERDREREREREREIGIKRERDTERGIERKREKERDDRREAHRNAQAQPVDGEGVPAALPRIAEHLPREASETGEDGGV